MLCVKLMCLLYLKNKVYKKGERMTKKEKLALVIIFLVFVVGAYFYPSMPGKVACFWSDMGTPIRYMSREVVFSVVPFLMSVLFLLYFFWLKERYQSNVAIFEQALIYVLVFLGAFQVYVVFRNGGMVKFGFIPYVSFLFTFLYISLSSLIVKLKPFSEETNEEEWKKTKQKVSTLLIVTGLFSLFGIFFSKYALFFYVLPIISVYLYVFSPPRIKGVFRIPWKGKGYSKINR